MLRKAVKQIAFVKTVREIFDEEYLVDTIEYDQQLQNCRKTQQLFYDQAFPPKSDSLSKETLKKSWETIQWRRAKDIFGADFQIFQDKIEPNDIQQGKLGDCYFLSALSVLSEKNELVRRLFHTTEPNEEGIYSLWLNINGEWTNIVVDDFFPCLPNGKPAFSRANGPELWVMLLEKAFAKAFGSYAIIEGGNPALAMRDLTGAPYENKDSGDAKELWDYCFSNYEQGFLLTAYTKETQLIEEENDLGILSGHAYSILRLANVVDNMNQNCQILQVRNPWGRVEWKGDWSDQSQKWTQKILNELNVVQKDDGVFWISIEDFRKYFEGVGVCKVRDNYVYNSVQCQNPQIVHVEVEQDCDAFFSLNQIDDRFINNNKYAFARIVILQICYASQLKYVGGNFRADRSVVVQANLKKGAYLVLVEMQTENGQINLSTYASKRLKLKRTQGLNYFQLLQYMIKDYTSQNLSKCKVINYQEQYQKDIEKQWNYNYFRRTGTLNGLLYFHYINRTNDSVLKESITLSDVQGYEALSQLENIRMISFIQQANTEIVILLTQCRSENGKCTYTYQTGSQIIKQQNNIPKCQFELEQLNISKLQLVGRHPLNKKMISIQQKNRINIFERNENVEITAIEQRLFNYFNDFLSDYWVLFIIIVYIIYTILNLILSLRCPQFLQGSILVVFGWNVYNLPSKKIVKRISQIQLMNMGIQVLTHIIGDICMALPLSEMGGFFKFISYLNIVIGFLFYMIELKLLIHYESVDMGILSQIRIKIDNFKF